MVRKKSLQQRSIALHKSLDPLQPNKPRDSRTQIRFKLTWVYSNTWGRTQMFTRASIHLLFKLSNRCVGGTTFKTRSRLIRRLCSWVKVWWWAAKLITVRKRTWPNTTPACLDRRNRIRSMPIWMLMAKIQLIILLTQTAQPKKGKNLRKREPFHTRSMASNISKSKWMLLKVSRT